MARNVYGGYCRECGRWTPPGFGHFERYRGGWRIHCVECASGRKLPPEGDQAAQDMRRHVRNMVNDGRYGKRGYRRRETRGRTSTMTGSGRSAARTACTAA